MRENADQNNYKYGHFLTQWISAQGIHFSTLEIQIKMILINPKSSEKFTDILESSCPKIFGKFWEELLHC